MKNLFILFIILLISNSHASECSKQKDETGALWTQKEGRTQMGDWVLFTGKGLAKNLDTAYFRAEGLALARLTQECRFIHKKARIVERCDEKIGDSVIAYARVNVSHKNCATTQTSNNKKNINLNLSKSLNEYRKYAKSLRSKTYGNNSKDKTKQEIKKLYDSLNALFQKKRTSKISQKIQIEQQEIKKLESKIYKNKFSCKTPIDCIELGKSFFEKGLYHKAANLFSIGCFVYKDPETCNFYGVVSRDVLKNKPSASSAFQLACNKKHPDSCNNLAKLEERSRDKNAKVKAKMSYTVACRNGSALGCYNRGRLTQKKGNREDILNYYDKACIKLKGRKACKKAAQQVLYYASANLRKNDKKTYAEKYLSFGCEVLKDTDTCFRYVLNNFYSKKSSKSLIKKKYALIKKYCKKDHLSFCTVKGKYLSYHFNKSKQATSIFYETCSLNNGFACVEYANVLRKNKKYKQSIYYYEKSCNFNNYYSCFVAAQIYRQFLNKGKKAHTLYTRSCKRHAPACTWMAILEAQEFGNVDKSLSMLAKTCTKNSYSKNGFVIKHAEACYYLSKIEVEYKKKFKNAKKILTRMCITRRNGKFLTYGYFKKACNLLRDIEG